MGGNTMKKNQKGFTLIELLIVVAIIAILAAIAIPQFSAYRKRGYNAAANSDLRNIRTSEEAMFADFQDYGTSRTDNTYGGPGADVTATFLLVGGKTTTSSLTNVLSAGVYAGVLSITNQQDVNRSDFMAITVNSNGDNYYGTTNGSITGSSSLFRHPYTGTPNPPTPATTKPNVSGTTAGIAWTFSTAQSMWVQM
jgi:prepilin-type N-terminal cleavage/methylation domain-containing protein